MTREELNDLSREIIGLAIKVHKTLGPGFTEKIYEKALVYELNKSGKKVDHQSIIKVKYGTLELGGQRIDLIVEDEIELCGYSFAQFAVTRGGENIDESW